MKRGWSGVVGAFIPLFVYSAEFTVTTTNDGGAGSFRQALLDANATPGRDTITFNIPPGGFSSIVLTGAPPAATEAVVIDGTTQPGFSGTPVIELTCSPTGPFFMGLTIAGGHSVVRGLAINRMGGDGLILTEGGTNVIEGNIIGLDATGTAPRGNTVRGIVVSDSSGNRIGGTNTAQRNIISGNVNGGLDLLRSSDNVIWGNFIGTDITGTNAIRNQDGISISGGSNNVVGGDTPAYRNVISGNGRSGLAIRLGANNRVVGNFIGTDVHGRRALSNGFEGVLIVAQMFTVVRSNVVSGNAQDGIVVQFYNDTYSNRVEGNFIGVDATGTNALANGWNGLVLNYPSGALVEENVIAGNRRNGIRMDGAYNAYPGVVRRNIIGLDASGSIAVPNGEYGIDVFQVNAMTIGGWNTGDANVISANGLGGIHLRQCCVGTNSIIVGNLIGFDVTGTLPRGNLGPGIALANGTNNAIRANRIAFNTGLGIDLGLAGPLQNDIGDFDSGANFGQNFPIISSATNTGTNIVVRGVLRSVADTFYDVDLFVSDFCDLSGYGEGQTYLGSITVETDDVGEAGFEVMFPAVPGRFVSATATDPGGNTSEFSPCLVVDGVPQDFRLSIRGSMLRVIEWSSAAMGFQLQYATNLAPPVQWITVSNDISDDGMTRRVVAGQDHLMGNRFYRLTKP